MTVTRKWHKQVSPVSPVNRVSLGLARMAVSVALAALEDVAAAVVQVARGETAATGAPPDSLGNQGKPVNLVGLENK
jgi:hypothetical protein